jgi:hypothetical protein
LLCAYFLRAELDALNFEDVTTSGRRTLIAVTDPELQPTESKVCADESDDSK